MKKLVVVILSILFLSCSSDSDKSNDDSGNKTNFVEIEGTKYYFDNVTVTKYDKNGAVDFTIDMQNTPLTNRLFFSVRYLKTNSSTDNYDLLPTTYPYKGNGARLSGSTLAKYNSDGTYNVITNESDFVGELSRVIVIMNSETNYSFNFNYVTTVGNLTGSYTGDIKKVSF